MTMTFEQLKELAKMAPVIDVDRVALSIDDDRRFFERHPHRRYRVRAADPIEVTLHELSSGAVIGQPPKCIFVVVSNIAPGVRLRFFIVAPADAETDLTEDEALFVFDAFVPEPHQEMEARVRKAYPPSAVGTSNAVNPERGAIIVRGKQLGAAS